MVMEVAILDVKPDLSHDFEAAFTQAQTIIASMAGYATNCKGASRRPTGTSS